MIGKRKGLVWGCKKEENERFVWYLGLYEQYPVNLTVSKRRISRERENITQRPTCLNAQNTQ